MSDTEDELTHSQTLDHIRRSKRARKPKDNDIFISQSQSDSNDDAILDSDSKQIIDDSKVNTESISTQPVQPHVSQNSQSQKSSTPKAKPTETVSKNLLTKKCDECKQHVKDTVMCGRCDHLYCPTCSELKPTAMKANKSHLGFVWLCKPCRNPGLKSMKTDCEIEARCADYFKTVTERINKIEREVEKKPDRDEVAKIIDEKLRGYNPTPIENDDVTNLVTQKVDDAISDKLKGYKANPNHADNDSVTNLVTQKVDDAIAESRDQERRKLNLIIHGLPESTKDVSADRMEDDRTRLTEVCTNSLDTSIDITNSFCLGTLHKEGQAQDKPRPLKVSLLNTQQKRKLLTHSKNLKTAKDKTAQQIFIKPDQTPLQREQQRKLMKEKKLRTEEEERLKTGKTWKISRGILTKVDVAPVKKKHPKKWQHQTDGMQAAAETHRK